MNIQFRLFNWHISREKMLAHFETNIALGVDSNRSWRQQSLHSWIMLGIVTRLRDDFGGKESGLVFGESGHGGGGRAAVGLTNWVAQIRQLQGGKQPGLTPLVSPQGDQDTQSDSAKPTGSNRLVSRSKVDQVAPRNHNRLIDISLSRKVGGG
jgi:hypothetical protein